MCNGPRVDVRLAWVDVAEAGTDLQVAVSGRVKRITRIGFEIRVEVAVGDQDVTVTLTRNEFLALGLQVGSEVQIRVAAEVGAVQSRSEGGGAV